MLASVLDFVRILIQDIILTLGYTGIALVMLAENVFPPIPSELVMPFAGWLALAFPLALESSFLDSIELGTERLWKSIARCAFHPGIMP